MFVAIQYLRGIAAVAVVFKHASHPSGPLHNVLDAGVDLFFLVSGFVMVASTQGKTVGAREFIEKRCRRVLPMWWLTLGAVAILGLGVGGWPAFLLSFPLVPFQTHAGLGVGSVFWGVGWTLVFEAVFYAYFAAGLAVKADRFVFIVIPAMVLLGVLFGRSDHPLLNNAMHPLLLEFVMGAMVAKVILSGVTPSRFWMPLGLILFLLGCMIGADYEIRALTLGLPLALVVAGLASRPVPESASLRLIGDASYSIYLLHYIPIFLAWQYIPKDSYWALTAAAGIALGIVAFILVERPIMNAMRRKPVSASSPCRAVAEEPVARQEPAHDVVI